MTLNTMYMNDIAISNLVVGDTGEANCTGMTSGNDVLFTVGLDSCDVSVAVSINIIFFCVNFCACITMIFFLLPCNEVI